MITLEHLKLIDTLKDVCTDSERVEILNEKIGMFTKRPNTRNKVFNIMMRDKITQAELARRLGIGRGTLNHVIKGRAVFSPVVEFALDQLE